MLELMKSPWQNLSVFFPVYNEAAALPGVIERSLKVLEGLELNDYEIIVVDDGSSDGTAAIAGRYAKQNPHVRVVHHVENQGYGAALVSGFQAAKFDWVVYTDGDGQFDLGNITRFVEPSARADAVLGYRRQRSDNVMRKINAWAWGWLVYGILGLKVRDLDCGFKLIKTERLRKIGSLEARGAVITAELLMKLRADGCHWEEVGVEHYPRHGGAASGAKLSVIMRAARELIRLRQRMSAPRAV
jgi:glycosyltransferase involved in cell wall biosynthesis